MKKSTKKAYPGMILQLSYNLKTDDPVPVYKNEICNGFSLDEHRLFASGADIVWIHSKKGDKSMLNGYYELRRDVARMHGENPLDDIPIRTVTYAKLEREGIPLLTRLSQTERFNGKKLSPQSREIIRRY